MKNNKLNQSNAILAYFKSRSKSKMTVHQVAEGVKTKYGKQHAYTPVQVAKCLNRFKLLNLVNTAGKSGKTPTGRTCYKWALNLSK